MGCGIRTIADLKARCSVCEDSGCWVPKVGGRRTRGGALDPCVYLPAIGQTTTIGVAVAVLTTGKRPIKGRLNMVTCDTPHCANPEHRKMTLRGVQARIERPMTAQRLMAITAARRKNTAIPDETVEAIRQTPGLLREVAAQFGVSIAYVSRVRLGKVRAQLAPAASVFGWRP
jgi:hypothetical protein